MIALTRPQVLSQSQKEVGDRPLSLESTLQELHLYDCQVETYHLGKDVAQIFEDRPLLPGAVLTEGGRFVGTISRQRFLEKMSRPYGLELFLKRPLNKLYPFICAEVLHLPASFLIVAAAQKSLQRPSELLSEPIVVDLGGGNYRLLDVHQLLVAQSRIHELTTQMLDEQTQAQMLQTEKMASLGRMVAGVAHEIRNPVNCINGNFNFLENYCQDLIDFLALYEKEDFPLPNQIAEIKREKELDFILEDLPKVLKSIGVSTERLTKIVVGLHTFSHMDENRLQPTDLHDCLDSTLLILNNRLKQGIEVIKNYGDLPLINCYSGQLSQVFMNIISNAIDALLEKLEVTPEWQPQITITTAICPSPGNCCIEGDRCVSIKITDNGLGMPPEIQRRIFDTFFTTKPAGKGTGLGLAISYQIVTQKHRGQLLVRSSNTVAQELCLETGTEFEVLLPLL